MSFVIRDKNDKIIQKGDLVTFGLTLHMHDTQGAWHGKDTKQKLVFLPDDFKDKDGKGFAGAFVGDVTVTGQVIGLAADEEIVVVKLTGSEHLAQVSGPACEVTGNAPIPGAPKPAPAVSGEDLIVLEKLKLIKAMPEGPEKQATLAAALGIPAPAPAAQAGAGVAQTKTASAAAKQ